MVKEKTIEEKYQKLTQREHVLKRPGVYIGDVKKNTEELWVMNENNKMEKQCVEYSPGFMKIFDEILSNATDHAIRDTTVNTIKVDYSKETGEISVYNNGAGIPVVLHKDQNIYVPELIFGHLLSGSNYDDNEQRTVVGTNGLGSKCHELMTPIPMFNGEIKLAKDIEIGEIVIGDDGNPRTILNKIEGFGKMYEIIQNRGDNYKVNEDHILTLHMPDHKVILWNESQNAWKALWWDNTLQTIKSKQICAIPKEIKCPECNIKLSGGIGRHYRRMHKDKNIPVNIRKNPIKIPDMTDIRIVKAKEELQEFLTNINNENVFDISVKEYLALSKTIQGRLAGVRGECVNWEEKDVLLDPYVLGLWLGDGMKSGYAYACDGENDYQIINYLKEWGKNNDAHIIKSETNKYFYKINSIENKGLYGFAPLRKLLNKYNLTNNKHIPKEYLVNSREIRLNVLAGLIDTDGTLMRDGTRIIISQSYKHKKLIDDIVYLSRSLGFCTSVRNYIAKYTLTNGEKRESKAYDINISGNIEDIPTKLPRKICTNTKIQNTDKSTGIIKIKEIPDDKFVGFKIDGNERFLINDFTVTHNCTNIFSRKFVVETVDSVNKKKFVQTHSNNMLDKTPAKITSAANTKSYTKITFIPDYPRFSMENLEDDAILLIKKRVYDCIANTRSNISIYLNGEKIKGKSFTDYIKYYFEDSKVIADQNIQTIKGTEFIWEYAIVPSETHYEQVSFVNGNCTNLGGKHVDYILYQIINKIKELLETKKKLKDVKPNFIKEKFFFFLKATVINPSFNSQTKETLTTPIKDFGCKIEVTDAFINKIYKSSIIDEIVEFCKLKENTNLAKTDGKKQNKIYIPKLEDAIYAGTAKSQQCTLILTEGLSAMTFAMWGRSVVGPEKFGVFPLKGVILNVRDASVSQLINNEEINNIKQIVGLKENHEYKDTSNLRYNKIMILTDSDSVTFDTPCIVKNINSNEVEIKSICEINNGNWITCDGKEYSNCDQYLVWSDNGWTKIKSVMRHFVNKPIHRVLTHTGCVDVTEDHSLLNNNGEEITVKECVIKETELLHKKYIQENIKDYNINEEYAWALGYFQADGNCTIDGKVRLKRKDGSICNTFNSCWSITCIEKEPLEKLKKIFEKYEKDELIEEIDIEKDQDDLDKEEFDDLDK